MKTVLVIVAVLLWALPLGAAPYLVCDLPPAESAITAVKGAVDGVEFISPYTVRNGVVIIYDIGTLSPTKHSFTGLRFVNERGEGVAVPFDLPQIAPPPAGLRVVP